MIPVRPAPPSPPVVWCGVVVGCLPPPCGVVWFGCGLWWFPPFPPCGVVWVGWFPSACLDLLGVFGKPMLMMILMMMMMMMTIVMNIIITIILVFLWLVVGYLLPTCLLTIVALLTVGRGPTPWGHDLCDMCRFGAIAIGLQWVNCHRDRACQGVTAALFVGIFFRKCLQSHGTRSS